MTISKKAGLLLSFIMLLLPFTQAQTSLPPLDSVAIESIPFSEIPSSMAQSKIKTRTILENMVTIDFLDNRKYVIDTTSANMNKNIRIILSRPIEEINTRYIANSQLVLKTYKGEIKDEVNRMSGYINALDRSDNYIKNEKELWRVTSEELVRENYSSTMLDRVTSVDASLDSAHQEIALRTEKIFFILEMCTKTNVALDAASVKLNESQAQLEEILASSKNPSIFKLDYHKENRALVPLIKVYLKDAAADVTTYIGLREGGIISFIVVFLLLSYIFYSNRKKFKELQEVGNNYYQQKLGLILRSPMNAALILTLAVGSLILKDRPIAVKSLMLYISLYPLFVLSKNVIRKDLHKYIISFFLLALPIIGFSVFPPDNIFYRFILLFLAIAETLILWHFFIHQVRNKSLPKEKGANLVRVIVYTLFVFAIISLVCAVWGKISLAQTLLLTTFNSVFLASILYNSLVMVNGLFITILESKKAQKVNAFATYHQVITTKFVKIINVLVAYFWIMQFLKQLKIWEPVSESVRGMFGYEWQVGAMTINFGNIIIFFLVIYISTLLSRALQIILEGDILNKMKMAKGLPHSIAVMVRYTFIVVGIAIAASAVGLQFGNFAVIFGALSVGIGFGLQSIFNNLVSGFILLFERPVKIGDTIEIGELTGKVKSIGIRSSNIHTIDGAEVIVPNGHLVSNELINWTLSDQRRRIEVLVGVSYDSDPQQVKRILEEILYDHPLIIQDPRPSVFFLEMGESSLDFRMLFWTASYSEWYKIRSEIVMSTFETLKKNNITIPFPQRDINIKTDQHLPV